MSNEPTRADLVNGWYCEHHDKAVTGYEAARWETYCRANRRCEIGPAGCHAMIWLEGEDE